MEGKKFMDSHYNKETGKNKNIIGPTFGSTLESTKGTQSPYGTL